MKNDILKTVCIIMGVIFACFFVALGALYVFSQDRKYDWDEREAALPVEEVEEEVDYITPDDVKEEVEYKFSTEDICDIYLYSRSRTNPYENYWFEYRVEEGKLYFSCNYTTEKCLLEIENQEIDADRLDEALVIINRYTMVNMINDFREGKKVSKAVFVPDEGSDVEDRGINIEWTDGEKFEFGFPNGAGDQLVKYFKRMADWMTDTQSN